ncbi:MAG: response regulator transcription factor [Jiangellaceae bacterium]|nr:response regulator transcription factor [Jiangellaceae bacterium]
MVHPVTVAFVEDQPVAIEGVRSWIAADPGKRLSLIAVSGSVSEVLSGPGGQANVLLMDLQLADDRVGLQQEEVSRRVADIEALVDANRRVVVYSQHDSDEVIRAVLDAGASAYLAKREVADHLIDAILAAAEDRPYMPPEMTGAILTDDKRPQLSDQEFMACRLWFQGMKKAQVARRMGIRESTVRQYIARVRAKYAKVGRPAGTKADLLARAIQDGLINAADISPRS